MDSAELLDSILYEHSLLCSIDTEKGRRHKNGVLPFFSGFRGL